MTTANESSDRVQREKAFHNEAFSDKRRSSLGKFYRVCRSMYREYESTLQEQCSGKRVLEYGCGITGRAFETAKSSAYVVGIDISDVAVQQSRQQAQQLGIQGKTEFIVMNAEAMTFPDGEFDVVFGSGILHHLNLAAAASELHRVLKPTGVAIFTEPLGHNPVINLFRKLTPKLRTADEHPLLMRDIAMLKQHFPGTEVSWHSLTTPYVAVLPKQLWKWALPMAEAADRMLFTIPWIRPLAWFAIIKMAK